jgi:hypothetical protein
MPSIHLIILPLCFCLDAPGYAAAGALLVAGAELELSSLCPPMLCSLVHFKMPP